jgi:hypothetical protein
MSGRRRGQAEPSSWWPLVSMVLGALGSYALLVVHLVLEATGASPWLWAWMAVPGAFFFAAALTLAIGSGVSVRERLTTIPAALLGYSPRGPEFRTRGGAQLAKAPAVRPSRRARR